MKNEDDLLAKGSSQTPAHNPTLQPKTPPKAIHNAENLANQLIGCVTDDLSKATEALLKIRAIRKNADARIAAMTAGTEPGGSPCHSPLSSPVPSPMKTPMVKS